MDKGYNLNGGFQPTTKRNVDINGDDFYPTPSWATHALMENESFKGTILECACGDGAMSKILEQYNPVISSDLYDRDYGTTGVDFLATTEQYDNIITNPPFNSAESFVLHAYKLSKNKFALLLRLAFLESAKRQTNIFNIIPPCRVWVFSERITFYPKDKEKKGTGTTAYAWFVWDKENKTKNTEIKWLPLGLKEKFKD